MKAAFILETADYKWTRGQDVSEVPGLTQTNLALLEHASEVAGVDADIIFAVEDLSQAGKAKSKIGITRIRKERNRVLSEIARCNPEVVICFGPTAVASVFDHGNLSSKDLFRKAHRPLSGMLKRQSRDGAKLSGATTQSCNQGHQNGTKYLLNYILLFIMIQN
jgi:hypothetical protein